MDKEKQTENKNNQACDLRRVFRDPLNIFNPKTIFVVDEESFKGNKEKLEWARKLCAMANKWQQENDD